MEWARIRSLLQQSPRGRGHQLDMCDINDRSRAWSSPGSPLALGLAALFLAGPVATGFPQDIGEPALPIDSPVWINLVGALPSLELLRGQTVILHFFGGGGRQANFNYPRKYHHKYRDKGLIVLGITSLPQERLDKVMERENIPFPIAVESDMGGTWGLSSSNYQITIGTDGNVFFRGPTNSLWNGKLLKGLKGADRYGERQALRLVPSGEFSKSAKKALGLMAAGKLKKALKVLDASIAKGAPGSEKRIDADSLRNAIDEHVALLVQQMNANAKRGEVLIVRDTLAVLVKELKGHPLGDAVREIDLRLAEDQAFLTEVAAAEEYENLISAYYSRGLEKNMARFRKLIEKYAGTRTAQKARNVLHGRSM